MEELKKYQDGGGRDPYGSFVPVQYQPSAPSRLPDIMQQQQQTADANRVYMDDLSRSIGAIRTVPGDQKHITNIRNKVDDIMNDVVNSGNYHLANRAVQESITAFATDHNVLNAIDTYGAWKDGEKLKTKMESEGTRPIDTHRRPKLDINGEAERDADDNVIYEDAIGTWDSAVDGIYRPKIEPELNAIERARTLMNNIKSDPVWIQKVTTATGLSAAEMEALLVSGKEVDKTKVRDVAKMVLHAYLSSKEGKQKMMRLTELTIDGETNKLFTRDEAEEIMLDDLVSVAGPQIGKEVSYRDNLYWKVLSSRPAPTSEAITPSVSYLTDIASSGALPGGIDWNDSEAVAATYNEAGESKYNAEKWAVSSAVASTADPSHPEHWTRPSQQQRNILNAIRENERRVDKVVDDAGGLMEVDPNFWKHNPTAKYSYYDRKYEYLKKPGDSDQKFHRALDEAFSASLAFISKEYLPTDWGRQVAAGWMAKYLLSTLVYDADHSTQVQNFETWASAAKERSDEDPLKDVPILGQLGFVTEGIEFLTMNHLNPQADVEGDVRSMMFNIHKGGEGKLDVGDAALEMGGMRVYGKVPGNFRVRYFDGKSTRYDLEVGLTDQMRAAFNPIARLHAHVKNGQAGESIIVPNYAAGRGKGSAVVQYKVTMLFHSVRDAATNELITIVPAPVFTEQMSDGAGGFIDGKTSRGYISGPNGGRNLGMELTNIITRDALRYMFVSGATEAKFFKETTDRNTAWNF